MNGNEGHRLQLQLQRCTFSVITSATTRVKTGAELSSALWLGRVPGRPDTFKHIKKIPFIGNGREDQQLQLPELEGYFEDGTLSPNRTISIKLSHLGLNLSIKEVSYWSCNINPQTTWWTPEMQ